MKKRILFFSIAWMLFLSIHSGLAQSGAPIPNTKGPFLRHNQSKIIWFDGYWWGTFFSSNFSKWALYKFDGNNWQFQFTIDITSSSRTPDIRLDALNHQMYILFPISQLIFRYTYSGGSWSLDSGFPHTVPDATSGSKNNPPVLVQAMDGDLFVISVHDSALWVTFSQDGGVTWPAASTAIRSLSKSGGLVDAVSFQYSGNNYIGVMVSEDAHGDVFFMKLRDDDAPDQPSNWSEETLPNPPASDDHVCLVKDFDNNLYGIMKWGQISGSTPHFSLYKRNTSGSWSKYDLYDNYSGNTTRPALTINETTNQLYVFATVNDKIGYAVLDKDNLSDVQTDDWITLIENGSDQFNDVSATYQQISSSSGLMITGLNVTQNVVWYRYLPIDFTPMDDLIISEVHSHSNVNASYVELLNRGTSTVNLSDYDLNYYDNGSHSATSTKALSGSLDPNQFVVLARDGTAFENEYGFIPDFTKSSFKFDGGEDGIALVKNGQRVDYFNNATGDMTSWPANYLFERGYYPNDGSNITFDYVLKGSNQAGNPSGGSTVTAHIRYVTLDQSTYDTGTNMSITEEIDTDISSQNIKVVTSILDDQGIGQNSVTRYLTIQGNDNDSFVETLQVPGSLSSGTYDLQVTVYDESTNNLQDVNKQSFDVRKSDTWRLTFTISSGSVVLQRSISGNTEATDGFDAGLDSSLAAPGSDFYSSFYISSAPNYLKKDDRYWDSPFDTPIDWTLKILNSSGGLVTVQWDSGALPAEGVFLLDGLTNPVNMRTTGSVTFSGDHDLTIQYRKTISYTFDFAAQGWYMVSLPLYTENTALSSLFPNVLIAYEWDPLTENYVSVTQLEAGKGYWFAVLTPHSRTISGTPVSNLTLQLSPGWNLIGSLFSTTDFSDPQDSPDGSVVATYGYDETTGNYFATQTLQPQKGYWVASVQDCNLSLDQQPVLSEGNGLVSYSFPLEFTNHFQRTPPPAPTITAIRTSLPVLSRFSLNQNYPNPFNPVTTIGFQLPEKQKIDLSVYNVLGQKISTLLDGQLEAGYHEVKWNARDAAGRPVNSGIYYYKLTAGNKQFVRKMILLK